MHARHSTITSYVPGQKLNRHKFSPVSASKLPFSKESGEAAAAAARFVVESGTAQLRFHYEAELSNVVVRVDLRSAQVFELGPVESICVDEGSNGGENEKIASEGLKHGVFEISLTDLQGDEDQSYRKISAPGWISPQTSLDHSSASGRLPYQKTWTVRSNYRDKQNKRREEKNVYCNPALHLVRLLMKEGNRGGDSKGAADLGAAPPEKTTPPPNMGGWL
ncbi:hypothetical protein Sjap_008146 [Stephania japonica]|uniref:Probable histone-arginine methyltransferase CARM1-like N-terminal PH domain-containing protein n=1 Tax=Stephania japonica TaxID=461633 RepID=A0AAP0JRA8_9MAGN